MLTQLAGRLLDYALWPAALAHEATHLAVLAPWIADINHLDLHPDSRHAFLDVDIDTDIPRWVLRFAAVAPPIFGGAVAVAVILWIVLGTGQLPANATDWGLWLAGSAYWVTYASPSREDLKQ